MHLKRKVRNMLAYYKSMYPELSGGLPYVFEELEDEIANQFLSAGVVYHRPNRIAPSMKHEEPFSDILFQRGIALDSITCVSGIGFYGKQEGATNPDRIKTMFGLEHGTLQSLPPIEYFEDGALIHVRMNYLLPPRELEFLKLYSWPEICTSLPCNFRRKLSAEVFTAIKNVLSDEGYEFKGGMI